MKQLTNNIFVGLGVIFIVFIVAGILFVVADPYNLKPLIFGTSYVPSQNSNSKDNNSSTSTSATDGSFQLSDAQKQALVSFGVDPSSVPNTISAEQENCFVSVLGEARVAQIRDGAVPSGIEFFKAKACI